MHEIIAQHAQIPRLIMLDDFGNNVGNVLPPEAPDVFHEAANYSDSPTFNGLLSRLPDTDSLLDNSDMGCEFMLLASQRARGIGDFEAAGRFVEQAAAFTRAMPKPLQDINGFEVASEKAHLLAHTGQTFKAEKALQAALTKAGKIGKEAKRFGMPLTDEQRTALESSQYEGYLTLAAFQGRQGRFSKALKSARQARSVYAYQRDMLDSQAALEAGLIPALESLLGERGDNKQGLTPEEEEALWTPLEAGASGHKFRVERPLTPDERERYSYIHDPNYLPTRAEAGEALAHDRTLELIHSFFRSGLPGERYELLTAEYIAALGRTLIDLAGSRPDSGEPLRVLEVGAGEARLSAFICQELERQGREAQVWASDLNADNVEAVFDVERRDYREALEAHRPHVVLSSWMPLGEDWTPAFCASEDVGAYVLIGSPDICAAPSAWTAKPGFELRDLEDVNRLKEMEHPYGMEMGISRETRAFVRS